jgi:hypothetical protein
VEREEAEGGPKESQLRGLDGDVANYGGLLRPHPPPASSVAPAGSEFRDWPIRTAITRISHVRRPHIDL